MCAHNILSLVTGQGGTQMVKGAGRYVCNLRLTPLRHLWLCTSICTYSGTPLTRTPLGERSILIIEVSLFQDSIWGEKRCPDYRGVLISF